MLKVSGSPKHRGSSRAACAHNTERCCLQHCSRILARGERAQVEGMTPGRRRQDISAAGDGLTRQGRAKQKPTVLSPVPCLRCYVYARMSAAPPLPRAVVLRNTAPTQPGDMETSARHTARAKSHQAHRGTQSTLVRESPSTRLAGTSLEPVKTEREGEGADGGRHKANISLH